MDIAPIISLRDHELATQTPMEGPSGARAPARSALALPPVRCPSESGQRVTSSRRAWTGVAAAILIATLGCFTQAEDRPKLLVFAAVSLTDSLTKIGSSFEEQGYADVSFSFGASQTLAQQIASGAPADLFIAAGEFPVEFLAERGLVGPERVRLLTNTLVVVTRVGGVSLKAMAELSSNAVSRIAVADPELAPAGRYARESLESLGLWDSLQPKLVLGPDVRATLSYLEAGNVDVAIVYRTDARTASDAVVSDLVPPGSYSPIVYPAAVVLSSDQLSAAGDFLAFLQREEATRIFREHGFEPWGAERTIAGQP